MRDRVANPQKGIAILETVVTLALMTLIVVATVPLLLRSVSGLQLGVDTQNIASELQLAKFRASSQSTQYQVVFNTTNATSKLQRRDPSTGQFQDEGNPIALASTSTYINSPNSVPLGAPASLSASIRFNAHGVPIDNSGAPTGNNAVYLGNGSNIMYAITVPLSGKIQMWWYDGSQWVAQ